MSELRFCRELDVVDWPLLAKVFERAPLGTRDPVVLERSFRNSQLYCFVYAGAQLIGAGRALSDHVNWTIVFDVVLLPEYQGRGMGRALMQQLLAPSCSASVMLHSAPGKEAFYERLGFRRMKTAMARFGDPARARQRGFID